MDRNDKRSPRVADQLDHELQGFVQGAPVPNRDDNRLQEEIGRLEPGLRPLTAEPVGGEPSIDEVIDRQDFARWLRPSDLPAPGHLLAASAMEEGAPAWVVEALESGGDRIFDTIGEAYDATAAGRPHASEDDA